MKKNIIDNKQKEDILRMHGFIKEQAAGLGSDDIQPGDPGSPYNADGTTKTTTPPTPPTPPAPPKPVEEPKKETKVVADKDKLQRALESGCIDKYSWFTADPSQPLRKTKSGKDVIYGKGSNGNTYFFYANMKVANTTTGIQKNWTCEELNKTPEVKLNANQNKVLEIIGKRGWFATPVPTDVEVDDGTYIKQDLTKSQDALLQKYSKYFTDAFPTGYFVYKIGSSTPTPSVTPTPTGGSVVVPPKTTEEIKVQNMNPTQLSDYGKNLMAEVEQNYSVQACTKLVDTYFKMAQDGTTSNDTETFKAAIYKCNNNNRANWKEETKDKLRWLRGDEEDAKKIFGLFKRFPKIGNIRDTTGRKAFRLNQLPQV
jgi:hypothetical protein